MCRVSGRTLRTSYFVNSGEVASNEMLLITLLLMTLHLMTCLQELFFKLVTSDALEGEKNHKKGGLNCVFGNFFFYVLENCSQVQSLK